MLADAQQCQLLGGLVEMAAHSGALGTLRLYWYTSHGEVADEDDAVDEPSGAPELRRGPAPAAFDEPDERNEKALRTQSVRVNKQAYGETKSKHTVQVQRQDKVRKLLSSDAWNELSLVA